MITPQPVHEIMPHLGSEKAITIAKKIYKLLMVITHEL